MLYEISNELRSISRRQSRPTERWASQALAVEQKLLNTKMLTEQRRKELPDMNEMILLCEWDSEEFRKKLAHWESLGYEAVLNTYKIDSDIDPCTGRVYLRYSIDLKKTKEPYHGETNGKGKAGRP